MATVTGLSSAVTPSVMAAGRTILIVGKDAPIRRALALLLDALGAAVLTRTPSELPVSDELQLSGVVALGDEMVDALRPDQLASGLAALHRWPLLVVGLGADGAMLDALAEVTGVWIQTASPGRTSSYSFAAGEAMLWPFEGMILDEGRPRAVMPLAPEDRALQPLISTPSGHVMARLVAAGAAIHVTTVSGWEDGPPPVLWRSFCAESFLDTLPVMAFARSALGGRGWARPTQQASCIVDDPNLRGPRYGHLDFRDAVQIARERPFHLAVGFVPLDYGTTSPTMARFFREHTQELSLLIHGNDHIRRELARDVAVDRADRSVRQALARMGRHEAATGVSCAPVMTPPHGACTRPWVRALGAAGYTAVVATATHPYTDRPEDEGAGELHEFFCGEMSLFGFPVILRFPAVGHRNRWLFAAWLGKPLIIYAHHGDFAGGAEELLAGVDFINQRVAPQWASIAEVVHDNYQLRTTGRTATARVFSNDVAIRLPDRVDQLVVSKEGRDIPWETEMVLVDDLPVAAEESSGLTLRVAVPTGGRSMVRVLFRPVTLDAANHWQHASPRSRSRRLVTEARDRLAPVVDGAAAVRRHGNRGGPD